MAAKYKKVSPRDRDYLYYLLHARKRGSDEWKELDGYWRRIYRYTLRVQLIFDFIEKLIVPSGVGEGRPFKLRPFQKDFIVDTYGPTYNTGIRVVLRAILSVGRKNGKTALIAALALVHLVGPESVQNGEIYSAANEREQAGLIFKYASQIVRADADLMTIIKIVDSTKTMVAMGNGSFYRAISAEAGTKFGLNPTVVIYDELAQSKNRDLYDALDTSMAARSEPLFVIISTQSNDPQHILSQLIDDAMKGLDPTTICHLHAVPEDAEDVFTSKRLWKMANPALGDFRSESEMRTSAKRAARMPTFEASFRNLYLNQRINAETPLVPRKEWIECKRDAKPGTLIQEGDGMFLGLDLSGKKDLSALVGVSSGKMSLVRAWFWKPEKSIKEHEKMDRVPYTVWAKQGLIETTPGRSIQYDWIAHRLGYILKNFTVLGIAFDRYRIDDLLAALEKQGVSAYVDNSKPPEMTGDPAVDAKNMQRYIQLIRVRSGFLRLVPWGQGYASMAPAVDALEAAILDRTLVHDGNPVLTWNFANAMAISDPAGNRKLDKSKTRFRIDGAVATTMAMGLKSRDLKYMDKPSVYETRGVLTFGGSGGSNEAKAEGIPEAAGA